jgi:formamidopyrimidine-DNA glycosylase
VPELPEVEAVRRELEPVMCGSRLARVIVRRPDLRVPFPPAFAARVSGTTVTALKRRAKYLLAELSSNETLIVHLGMSGSFRVDRVGGSGRRRTAATGREAPHDHVVFEMSSGVRVTFNDPRRFGLMDLIATPELLRYPALRDLGPEPLSDAFDAEALARACQGRKTPLKAALLDQRVVAGLGNIYAVEALHLAGLLPQRRASTIATTSGQPRDAARRLVSAIKHVLVEAIERQTGGAYRAARFRVYDREGQRCLRRSCRGRIRRLVQGGRSTFYCAACQR